MDHSRHVRRRRRSRINSSTICCIHLDRLSVRTGSPACAYGHHHPAPSLFCYLSRPSYRVFPIWSVPVKSNETRCSLPCSMIYARVQYKLPSLFCIPHHYCRRLTARRLPVDTPDVVPPETSFGTCCCCERCRLVCQHKSAEERRILKRSTSVRQVWLVVPADQSIPQRPKRSPISVCDRVGTKDHYFLYPLQPLQVSITSCSVLQLIAASSRPLTRISFSSTICGSYRVEVSDAPETSGVIKGLLGLT